MSDSSEMTQKPRRTRMAPTERREKILAAAADMFQRHGYAGANMDAIAAASGISGPGIYRYFNGKTELLLELLDKAAVQATAAISATVHSDEGASTARHVAHVLADHVLNEGPVIALLQGTTEDLDAIGKATLERLREDVVDHLASALLAARPNLEYAEAEGRVVAALAVVGQVRRILAIKNGAEVFRTILRVILDT